MKAPELIIIGLDGAVDSFAAKEAMAGNLPNFARLMKRGCRMTDFRPVHPTITPVCWSALQTGATPEINGIVADRLYLGGHISKLVSAYNGTHLKAERLWEAAARAGKTSIVDSMPVSGPRKSELVWQMEGTSGNPGRMIMPDGSTEYVDIPQQVWFFDKNKKPVDKLKDVKVATSPVTEEKDGVFTLGVLQDSADANRHNFLPISWKLEVSDNGFTLYDKEEKMIPLVPGKWTETYHGEFPTTGKPLPLAFRFICLELEDGFLIFASAACFVHDRVCPDEFAEMFYNMPPTPVHKEYFFFANPATNKIAMDSWEFHMQWHIEMFKRALEKKNPEIIVTYMGDIDTVNHFFWPELAGAKETTPEQYKFVEECYRKIYQTADRFIGYFLDNVADENTIIWIVSDHGSIGVKEERDINAALEKAGLLVRLPDRQIDWSKTKAAYRGCGHIFVNLEERGGGIVPASEYESTVDKVITALQDNLRGPDGDSYLAFAVRGREAGFFGLGGERCGDVVIGLTAGYAAMTVHAEQIPTATNSYGSMRALCMLSGPGVPENCVWENPVNSVDIAPTLCTKMGVPLPAQSNGRVIREFVDKK